MSHLPDSGLSLDDLRTRVDEIDARIHTALMERAQAEAGIQAAGRAAGAAPALFQPERDADLMRQMVERHQGDLPGPGAGHRKYASSRDQRRNFHLSQFS